MFIYFYSNCLRTCQYNPQYAQCMSYTQCPDKTMAIQSIHSQLLLFFFLLTNMSYILVNVRVGLVDISIKFNYHKLLHVSMPGMHLLPNHKSSCSRLKHPNNKPGIAIVAGTFNEGDLTIVWLLKYYTLLCNGLIIVSSCLCL